MSYCFSRRFTVLIDGVVPGHVQQWSVTWVGRVFESFFDAVAQIKEEFQLRASIAGWGHSLVTPLDEPLRLRERAGLFSMVGCRHEEDLGVDLFGFEFAGLDLWPVTPPGSGLDLLEVANDHPLQIRHPHPLHPAVGRTDRRVLAEHKVAVHTLIKDKGNFKTAFPSRIGQLQLCGGFLLTEVEPTANHTLIHTGK